MVKNLAVTVAMLAAGCGTAVAADETALLFWGTFKATASTPGGFSFVSGTYAGDTSAFVEPLAVAYDPAGNWTTSLLTSEAPFGAGVTATSSIPNTSVATFSTSVTGNGLLPVSAPSADANAYRSANFTLASDSSVTFSFNYLLSSSTAGLPPGVTYDDYVYASVIGPLAGGNSITLGSGPSSGTLSLTVSNSTAQTVTDTLYVGAASYEYTSAVPEPSTYALMLAGLGLVFVAGRRRAKKV
jgi:hypothetical protein